jgi:hypothetical protein
MGGACGTHGRDEKYNILVEYLKKRDHSEDLVVDRRRLLEWI